MAFTMPNVPPQLLALLGQQSGADPTQMPPGGAPLNARAPQTLPPQQAPGPLPMAQPAPVAPAAAPGNPMAAALGPSKPPRSSDDPGITGQPAQAPAANPYANALPIYTGGPQMPALPTPPDMSKSPVPAINQQYQDDLKKRAAFQPPNRADYQPTRKDKIFGGLIGAAAGLGGGVEYGREVGGNFINRKFNRANEQFERGTGALDKQLEAERGGFGIAEKAGDVPQTDFENKFKVAQEKRQQQTATSNAEYKSDLNDIKQNIAADKLDQAQKQLAEAAQKNQNDFQYHKDLLDLRKELIEAREKSGKGHSVAVGIEAKKAAALQKAQTAYNKETELAGNDPEARKQADENFTQAKQDAENGYEAEVNANGGEVPHQDVSTWSGKPGAAPPSAKPAASAGDKKPVQSMNKNGKSYKVGDTVTLKGGKSATIKKLYSDGTLEY